MRQIFSLFIFFSVSFFSVKAQYPGGRGAGANATIGHFYGRLVDSKTNKGIDAASVQLFQTKFDTTTKTKKDTLVGGMLTKANGDFSIENLPIFGRYTLKLSAIGYTEISQSLSFTLKMPSQDAQ